MKTYTIGFTRKPAQHFFELLKANRITTLLDVRLNTTSQLAGFAKQADLRYFLRELCQIDYLHLPELAPTKPLLGAYRAGDISWAAYEDRFLNLMAQRNIEKHLDPLILAHGCLLCSEHDPHHCHRRLVVEYLTREWKTPLGVTHLL